MRENVGERGVRARREGEKGERVEIYKDEREVERVGRESGENCRA